MNLLLLVAFSIIAVGGSWMFLKSTLNGAINLFNNSSSSGNMLGDGKKDSKVKFLDKKPVENPNTTNVNQNGVGAMATTNNNIPYYNQMGGANSMTTLPDVAGMANGVGGSSGVSATVGLVNVVGISSQTGNGQINNINKARKIRIGDFTESASAITNIKLKAPKGIMQNAMNISNNARKVSAINQGGQSFNAIARGRNLNQTGISSNLIQGNVRKIKAGQNHINTTKLKMKPISRVQNLNVQNFVAKKGLAMRLSRMANGLPADGNIPQIGNGGSVQGGENIQFNVNDLNVQRNSNFSAVNQHVYAGMQASQNEIESRRAFDADPRNQNLNDEERTKVYNISRYLETKTVGMSAGQYMDQRKKNDKIMDSVRTVVKVYPKATEQNLLEISKRALEKNKKREEGRKALAFQNASNGYNYDENTRKQIFDERLKGSQSANIRMEDWVNKNYSEQINNISDERMKEIRQQAEEYELQSRSISIEEKEENHARENANTSSEQERETIIEQKVEELTKQEIDNNRNSVLEAMKDQFVENPDEFRSIFGDEFVDKYNEAVNGKDEEFEKKFAEELAKIDINEQKEFLKKNPDKKGKSYYEIYKARKQSEFTQDVIQSARELYGSDGQSSRGNEDFNNVPQPEVTSENIYIPRYVQDQILENENA